MPGLTRRKKPFLRLKDQMTTAPEFRTHPPKPKDRKGLIRGTALSAIDAGISGGAVKWREALEEIARLSE